MLKWRNKHLSFSKNVWAEDTRTPVLPSVMIHRRCGCVTSVIIVNVRCLATECAVDFLCILYLPKNNLSNYKTLDWTH